jgi:hypothetical protein
MSLAQAEAIRVATGSYQPVPEDIAMAAALLSAIEYGPAALVRSPPVQQALEHMNERLRAAAEVSLQRWHFHSPAVQSIDVQQLYTHPACRALMALPSFVMA